MGRRRASASGEQSAAAQMRSATADCAAASASHATTATAGRAQEPSRSSAGCPSKPAVLLPTVSESAPSVAAPCYDSGATWSAPFPADAPSASTGSAGSDRNCWELDTEIGSTSTDQPVRRHNKGKKKAARALRQVAASPAAMPSPPVESPPVYEPYVDPAEQEEVQWLADHGHEEQEPWTDPEWERLCHTVGEAAERLMANDKNMKLPVALLKALWSLDSSFSQSLISRYQCQIANAIAPDENLSEADWWFMEAPEDAMFW